MAKNLSLSYFLRRRTHPLVVHSLKSPSDFYPDGNTHPFAIIALAIRLRAFLGRKTNSSFLSHKIIRLKLNPKITFIVLITNFNNFLF